MIGNSAVARDLRPVNVAQPGALQRRPRLHSSGPEPYWRRLGCLHDPCVGKAAGAYFAGPGFLQLQHALHDALRAPGGGLTLLTGVAGVGKTTLLLASADALRSAGETVILHDCSDDRERLEEELARIPADGAGTTPVLLFDGADAWDESAIAAIERVIARAGGQKLTARIVVAFRPEAEPRLQRLVKLVLGTRTPFARLRVEPLDPGNGGAFLLHRLRTAGFAGAFPLTARTMARLEAEAGRVPGRLLALAPAELARIAAPEALPEAARSADVDDARGPRGGAGSSTRVLRGALGAVVLAAIAGGAAGLLLSAGHGPERVAAVALSPPELSRESVAPGAAHEQAAGVAETASAPLRTEREIAPSAAAATPVEALPQEVDEAIAAMEEDGERVPVPESHAPPVPIAAALETHGADDDAPVIDLPDDELLIGQVLARHEAETRRNVDADVAQEAALHAEGEQDAAPVDAAIETAEPEPLPVPPSRSSDASEPSSEAAPAPVAEPAAPPAIESASDADPAPAPELVLAPEGPPAAEGEDPVAIALEPEPLPVPPSRSSDAPEPSSEVAPAPVAEPAAPPAREAASDADPAPAPELVLAPEGSPAVDGEDPVAIALEPAVPAAQVTESALDPIAIEDLDDPGPAPVIVHAAPMPPALQPIIVGEENAAAPTGDDPQFVVHVASAADPLVPPEPIVIVAPDQPAAEDVVVHAPPPEPRALAEPVPPLAGSVAPQSIAQAPAPSPTPAPAPTPAVIANPAPTPAMRAQAVRDIQRGDVLLGTGDVAAARLFYERAAALGEARAMTALARTYDPDVLRQLGVVGLTPDPERARYWYSRATETNR